MWWLDAYIVYHIHIHIYVYHNRLVNISFTFHSYNFVIVVMRTFKINSLSNFQVHNIESLTIVTMLKLAPQTYSSYNYWKLVPFAQLLPISPALQHLATTASSASMSLAFSDSTNKWDQTILVLLCPYCILAWSQLICVDMWVWFKTWFNTIKSTILWIKEYSLHSADEQTETKSRSYMH